MTDRFCTACGVIRLSVADTGNTCIHCLDNPLKPVTVYINFAPRSRPAPLPVTADGVVLCRCERGPATNRGKCKACNAEDERLRRQQRRQQVPA